MIHTIQTALAKAVRRLSAIPFFPADEDARLEIMRQLEAMIGVETLPSAVNAAGHEITGSTPQQRLDWLCTAAINAMRSWTGVPELRGILCYKFRPADGIECDSPLKGFRPVDSEALELAQHWNHKAIEAGKASPRLLEAAACDRLSSDEVAQLHRDTIGRLIETTRFPTKHTKSLADEEAELAAAPKRTLSEAEKSRRLAELEASLRR